jgi:hypothetical protein
MMRVILLAVLLVSSCAPALTKNQSFEHWTRYYETRMGLEKSQIAYEPTPAGMCAQVELRTEIDAKGPAAVLITYYDAGKWPCRSTWDLALHEACHRRMLHHLFTKEDVETMKIDPEAEAFECERWYRE